MTPPEPPPTPTPKPRRRLRRLALVGAPVLLVVVLGGVWLLRRPLAESYVEGALRAQGVPAKVEIDAIDLHHLSGQARLGPESSPDAEIDRIDADVTVAPLFSAHPLAVAITRVRLARPTLVARIVNGKLSFGSLDGLVSRLKPSPGGGPGPDVAIDQATLRLDTKAGALTLTGGGVMRQGRIETLSLNAGPATIQLGHATARVRGVSLEARAQGQDDVIDAHAALDSVVGPALDLRGADLVAHIDGVVALSPSPGLAHSKLHAVVKVVAARSGAQAMQTAAATLDLAGFAGDWTAGSLSAHADSGSLSMAAARIAGASAVDLKAAMTQLDLFVHGADWSVAARSDGALRAGDASVAVGRQAVRLANLAARWSGDAGYAPSGAKVQLNGALSTTATTNVSARALRSVGIAAPALSLALDKGAVRLGLGAPVTLTANGGRAAVAAIGGAPVIASAPGGYAGAFALATRGGDLPTANVRVSRYQLGDKGFDGQVAGDAAFSAGNAHGAKVQTAGRLRAGAAGVTFEAAACGPVSAARIDLGANSVERAAGQLCPRSGAPLLSTTAQGWRAAGRFTGLSGDVPGLLARATNAAGDFDVKGAKGLSGLVDVAQSRISDTSDPRRYEALSAAGRLTLAPALWQGRFDVATASGHPVGVVDIRHDPVAARGQALLTAPHLVFAKGGFQPGDLGPLGKPLSPTVGTVSFTGRVGWGGAASDSDGVLTTDDLTLKSALGTVSGLKARLRFVSLFPLETAPDQVVTAAKIDALTPLQAVSATFRLAPDALDLSAAEALMANGRVRLEPTRVDFDPKASSHGVLILDAVDLGKLIAASSLADKIDVDAVVSGRLPYALTPDGLRFTDGAVAAIRPGRLSIHRDALTKGPVTNAAQDFAYQALEALAFDKLDAAVQSRPEGRLGVLFHIKGHYAPKTHQEANVPIGDILNGSALKRQIPLPSDTPVNVNLDTSLNLDQVLKDYRQAFQVEIGGADVSPPLHSAPVQR